MHTIQMADDIPVSPTLLSFSAQPSPSVENLLVEGGPPQHEREDHEELDVRGSLRNIHMIDNADQKVHKYCMYASLALAIAIHTFDL